VAEDIVRVLRVLEYVGPRSKVEATIKKSINGTLLVNATGRDDSFVIHAATIGEFPDILLPKEPKQ
jgi:hypothetical protein